ncbi:hypothetical protein HD597_005211 [Nonomuraea thailandensis]|uniref:Uncharacterized protein n=1 Tax=Nonomuraea thailandensis TaxID=1188745 RepID=A0A9X2GFZ4_9ACTN|nr:hypothetical protein [Nonomuraea thailandensis]MCP2358191.1 hypothetical protein [Nonomuraea thailandensis]
MVLISRPLTGVGTLAVALCLSACGGQPVTSREICDKARPLLSQVANTDAATYGAHADEWHQIIDMAKQADNPDLAEFAELVDARSRNSPNYYSPLRQIGETACEGEKPDEDDA